MSLDWNQIINNSTFFWVLAIIAFMLTYIAFKSPKK